MSGRIGFRFLFRFFLDHWERKLKTDRVSSLPPGTKSMEKKLSQNYRTEISILAPLFWQGRGRSFWNGRAHSALKTPRNEPVGVRGYFCVHSSAHTAVSLWVQSPFIGTTATSCLCASAPHRNPVQTSGDLRVLVSVGDKVFPGDTVISSITVAELRFRPGGELGNYKKVLINLNSCSRNSQS